jgi:hypothetical protein
MRRRVAAALLVTLGCGDPSAAPPSGGASSVAAVGTSPPGPSPSDVGTTVERPVAMAGEIWEDVPDDVQARLRALAAAAKPLLLKCQDGPMKGVVPEQATERGFPFDRATFDAGCGEAAALYDAHVALLGRSRSGDTLLSNLARVADDVDYLHRAMAPDERASERGNAVHHVQDALRDALGGVDELSSRAIWPYHTVGSASPDGWRHVVASVHEWLGRLHDTLGKLAFTQGTTPSMVRGRMLESFFVGAEIDGKLRQRTLAALELDPAERAAREAYQRAELEALAALRDTELRYVRGEVTTSAIRTEVMARCEAAMAAYEAAWAAETKRVGAP